MTAQNSLSQDLLQRSIDVVAIENALVDMLVQAEIEAFERLGLVKGIMKLVDAHEQKGVLTRLGQHYKPEVELGGSAANALRGMAMLGSKVSYSAAIGEDQYGAAFSTRLDELGIINRLVRTSAAPTGTCFVVVTPDGERTMNTHLGACRHYRKSYVPEEDLPHAKVFFTTGYVWDTPEQIEAVEHAFALAKANRVKIAFDVADPFVVARWGKALNQIIEKHVDILFANAEEAMALVGCKGAEAATALSTRVEIAAVKDGSNGSFIASRGQVFHIPAFATKVVDTTGAGDMFAGGFLHGFTRGLPLDVCGRIAGTLAADTISYLGVRLSKDIVARATAAIGQKI